MVTNFSPSLGSYVLNLFPSIVMFGMKGFYISASGEIQGHHGPLVINMRLSYISLSLLNSNSKFKMIDISHQPFLRIFLGFLFVCFFFTDFVQKKIMSCLDTNKIL